MASARRDDLAKRLAERLDKAPSRGRVMSAPVSDESDSNGPSERSDRRSTRGSGEAPSERATRKAATSKGVSRKRTAPRQGAAQRRPASASSAPPQAAVPTRATRGAAGTVLRGHLIPDSLHADARRRKARLRPTRGTKVTWDDVMVEGVTMLVDRPDQVEAELVDVRAEQNGARRRLVQATLPADLDQRLVELHLDLGDDPDRAATYEQLWAAAIRLWLRST